MTTLFALTINPGRTVTSIDSVSVNDIDAGDPRIFVSREVDIDWLVEAIEIHLAKTACSAQRPE